MTDQSQRVRTLLTSVADDLPGGPITPPVADELIATVTLRRRRTVQVFLAFALVLLAITVPASVLGRHPAAPKPLPGHGVPPSGHGVPLPEYRVPTTGAYPTTGPGTAAALRQGHWSQLPAAPIVGRLYAATVWTGQEMLVWGGSSSPNDRCYVDGAGYDPNSHTWHRLAASPLAARSGMASVWTGNALFIWGGVQISGGRENALTDGALYDPHSDTWHRIAGAPLAGRRDAVAFWTGHQVVIIGGTGVDGEHYFDVAAYDPATDQWQMLPPIPLQEGVSTLDLTAVLTPAGIDVRLYWQSEHETVDGGGVVTPGISLVRYDPAAGTWQVLNAEQPRNLGTPLWTGRELIFPAAPTWYGYVPSPMPINLPGWRLTPTIGVFTPIPHGPIDYMGADSVWTGGALLSFNSGPNAEPPDGPTMYKPGQAAVWDPFSNTWSQLPAAPFFGGEAVWTGSELLEWGLMITTRPGQTPDETVGLSFG